MGLLDLQVVEHLHNLLTHLLEGVGRRVPALQRPLRLAMAPQIEEQYVEVLAKVTNLPVPDGRAAPRPMDKHDPVVLGAKNKGSVVQHGTYINAR